MQGFNAVCKIGSARLASPPPALEETLPASDGYAAAISSKVLISYY